MLQIKLKFYFSIFIPFLHISDLILNHIHTISGRNKNKEATILTMNISRCCLNVQIQIPNISAYTNITK